jgi:hypothetical protein
MSNIQQQRSLPSENVWEKRLLEQPSTSRPAQNQQQQQQQQQQQTPTRILKRNTNETNSTTTPKSAPASTTTQGKPDLLEMLAAAAKEQSLNTNPSLPKSTEKSTISQPVVATPTTIPPSQKSSILPPPPPPPSVPKLPEPEITFPTMNPVLPNKTETAAPLTTFPTNPGSESFLLRAIQESKQMHNLSQQQSNTHPAMVQQSWQSISPPSLPVIQQKPNDMSASIQKSWESHLPPSFIPAAQQQQQQQQQQSPKSRTSLFLSYLGSETS